MAMGTEKHARGSADDRRREPWVSCCHSMLDDTSLALLLLALTDADLELIAGVHHPVLLTP